MALLQTQDLLNVSLAMVSSERNEGGFDAALQDALLLHLMPVRAADDSPAEYP